MAQLNEKGWWLDKKGDAFHPDNVKAVDSIKDKLVEKLLDKSYLIQDTLSDFKEQSFKEVENYYSLLLETYDIDGKKNSKKGNLTLENFSGTKKVVINVADRIAFDEKLNIAKLKIDEYLHEITKDSSSDVQTLITKAFEVDKKGDVNAKKILALKSYDIKHKLWVEAMGIIAEATEIVSSKNYIRFYTRESIEEAYVQVSLDLAGV